VAAGGGAGGSGSSGGSACSRARARARSVDTCVAAEVSGDVDFTPFLLTGEDTGLLTAGFQGNFYVPVAVNDSFAYAAYDSEAVAVNHSFAYAEDHCVATALNGEVESCP